MYYNLHTSHWQELSYIDTPGCQGGQEMKSVAIQKQGGMLKTKSAQNLVTQNISNHIINFRSFRGSGI